MKLKTAAVGLALWLVKSAVAEPIPGTTGRYNVGVRRYTIDFTNKDDPTAPGNLTTEFLATIYYPTTDSPSPPKPYIEPELAQMYADVSGFNITHLTANFRWNASFLSKPAGPTLLFSPGGWGPSTDAYAILISELASHGYVTAALDHPYEQPFIRFPNGTGLVGLPIDFDYNGDISFLERLNDVRVREMVYFAEHWPTLVKKMHAPFQTKSLGTFGHSIGGSASLNAGLKSDAIAASINQDGSIWPPAASNEPSSDLHKPSLLLGFEGHNFTVDGSWEDYTTQQSEWWRLLTVNGAAHNDWSDLTFWKEFGSKRPLGSIDGIRMSDLTRTYVKAFFDKFLRGEEEPIFDQPSSEWAEVVYYAGSD